MSARRGEPSQAQRWQTAGARASRDRSPAVRVARR